MLLVRSGCKPARPKADDSRSDLRAQEHRSAGRRRRGTVRGTADRRAKSFISARVWTLDEACIYVDDGVSGSSFERPGFERMMGDAKVSRFDALVIFDQDRFSRADEVDTMLAFRELADHKVTTYDYSTGQAVAIDSWGGAMTYLKALVSRQNVEQASKHTSAGLRAKAERGEPLGPAPYGYKNVVVAGEGKERRDWAIDPAEKKNALKILTRYADEWKYADICDWLNTSGIRSARGGDWAPPSLRAMVRNPVYRGWAVGNKFKTVRKRGKRAFVRRPESERIKRDRPDLRILSEALTAKVDARIAREDKVVADSKPEGRAPWKAVEKYLLVGLLQCPDCGGNFQGIPPGNRKYAHYVCGRRRKYPGTCNCKVVFPMEQTDRAVLLAVERELRGGRFIEDIIDELLARREEAAKPDETRDRARLDQLLLDIKAMDSAKGVREVEQILEKKKAEVAELEAQLASASLKPGKISKAGSASATPSSGGSSPADLREFRAKLQRSRDQLIEFLRSETSTARRWLRKVLGPISFAWDHERDEPVWVMIDETKTDGFPFSVEGPNTGLIAWSAEFRSLPVFWESVSPTSAVEKSGGCNS